MSSADSTTQSKQSKLRAVGRLARANLSDRERHIASEKIAEKVVRSHWFQRADFVACYLSTPDEVATWTIIQRAWDMKKRIFAPVLKKNDFMQFCELTTDTNIQVNQFGIAEPVSSKSHRLSLTTMLVIASAWVVVILIVLFRFCATVSISFIPN